VCYLKKSHEKYDKYCNTAIAKHEPLKRVKSIETYQNAFKKKLTLKAKALKAAEKNSIELSGSKNTL
jgi:hypothetical protein